MVASMLKIGISRNANCDVRQYPKSGHKLFITLYYLSTSNNQEHYVCMILKKLYNANKIIAKWLLSVQIYIAKSLSTNNNKYSVMLIYSST